MGGLPRLFAGEDSISRAMKPSLSFALLACAALGFGRPAFAADAPAPKPPPTEVIQYSHDRVDHTFTTGVGSALLINDLYKVMAARRVAAPAAVEIHTRDTDVFYIVDGSATFVTGGTAVNPKEIGPNEIHATSIVGGTERHLSKGDIIIIPAGTPHQFMQVTNPFLYFVVKVTQ
jgi:mannose-6-phosphate isomerase-like protein (cupin superfamily)